MNAQSMSNRNAHGLLGSPLHTGIPSKKVLIDEQLVSDMNPLFELAKISYSPWHKLYPVQQTSPHRTPRTCTKR